jgi:hypothetical protein
MRQPRRNCAGTAPITRASGTTEVVLARLGWNKRGVRRLLAAGLVRAVGLAWRPRLLRRPQPRPTHRQDRPTKTGEQTRRYPPRLLSPPQRLRRTARLQPLAHHRQPRRLTPTTPECLVDRGCQRRLERPEEEAEIVALFNEWGQTDRSHRKLAHRGSYARPDVGVRPQSAVFCSRAHAATSEAVGHLGPQAVPRLGHLHEAQHLIYDTTHFGGL